MKKLLVVLLSVLLALSFVGCDKKNNGPDTKKSEGVMTYDEYVGAEVGSEVTIEGYVQAIAYAAAYGNCNLYVQDADGAYYVYRMPCTDADAAKLTVGTKVKISGNKAEWKGEIEIAEGTATYEVENGNWVAEATDVTALLGTDELIKHMNKFVSFTDLTVEPIKDADGNDVAFTYGWGGSASKGDNADLYFNVSYNGTVYNFCVESDETPEGTAGYDAVTNFQIGQKVSLEGFLYWYDSANPHITNVK